MVNTNAVLDNLSASPAAAGVKTTEIAEVNVTGLSWQPAAYASQSCYTGLGRL